MNAFKRNGPPHRSGGGRKFGGSSFKGRGPSRGGFGARPMGAPQLFEAVCAACGQKTEVPFRPNGRKPVYCRECFRQDDHAPQPSFDRGSFDRPKFAPRPSFAAAPAGGDGVAAQLAELNAKVDRIISEIVVIKEHLAD